MFRFCENPLETMTQPMSVLDEDLLFRTFIVAMFRISSCMFVCLFVCLSPYFNSISPLAIHKNIHTNKHKNIHIYT